MNVLLIAPFRDGSGWSQAALEFADFIYKSDIELICRNVKFNSNNNTIPNFVQLCEDKPINNVDMCVSFATPENLFYHSKIGKNITYSFLETKNIVYSDWVDRYNMMDEIWCPSRFIKETLINSGVKRPVQVVPVPYNSSRIFKKYDEPKEISKGKNGDFLFYTIADFNYRKNLDGLLKAFYSEFDYWEPVNIVIKTSRYQMNNYGESLYKMIESCQKSSKKDIIKDPIIIDESFLHQDVIYGIHQNCDVFVLSSRGEGWCIPCIDALAFKRTPIVPNFGSIAEYINNDNGYLIDCVEETCTDMANFAVSIYNSNETWSYPTMLSTKHQLRLAYENRDLLNKKRKSSEHSLSLLNSDIRKVLSYEQENQSGL